MILNKCLKDLKCQPMLWDVNHYILRPPCDPMNRSYRNIPFRHHCTCVRVCRKAWRERVILDGSREEEGGDDDDDDDDEGQKGMEKKESWFEKTVVITAFRKMKEFFIIVRVRSQDDRSLAGAFTNLMTGIHHHHYIKFLSSSSYPEYQFGTCQ